MTSTGNRKKSKPRWNRIESSPMASHDPKDDVDRLFACFKCGVSPPRKLLRKKMRFFLLVCNVSRFSVGGPVQWLTESAFRERPLRRGKKSRLTPAAESGSGGGGNSSSAPTPDVAGKV